MQMKIKIRSFLSPDLITAQSPSHSPPVLPARQMPHSAPLSRVDSFPVAVLDSHNRNTPSPAWGLRPGIAFTGLKSRCGRDPASWEAGGGLCSSRLPTSGVAGVPGLVAASLQPLPACPHGLLLLLCPSYEDICDSI